MEQQQRRVTEKQTPSSFLTTYTWSVVVVTFQTGIKVQPNDQMCFFILTILAASALS
jgi:hypothetical protein